MRRNCLFYVRGHFAIQEDMFWTLPGRTTNCARMKRYKPALSEFTTGIHLRQNNTRECRSRADPSPRHRPSPSPGTLQRAPCFTLKLIYGRCRLLPYFTGEESQVQRSVAWASDQLGNSPEATWFQGWPSPLHTALNTHAHARWLSHMAKAGRGGGSLGATSKLTGFSLLRLLSNTWEDGKKLACTCDLQGPVKLALAWGGQGWGRGRRTSVVQELCGAPHRFLQEAHRPPWGQEPLHVLLFAPQPWGWAESPSPVRDRGPQLTLTSDSWFSNKDSDTCWTEMNT